jgi:hypothetical protein
MRHLVLTHNIGGYRDSLDEREVHAGDGIDLWRDGRWIPGRYEFDGQTGAAWFIYIDTQGVERWVEVERGEMWFRWAE